jgi:C4-dicarboxylate-specific signal transduction histidine kinase
MIEPIDLRELLEDALRIHRAAISRHDIAIETDIALVPRIMTDKHKVLHILVNLISNAKDAMKKSVNKTLKLRVEASGGRARVSVGDTGVGIAAENMTRIFAHGFTTKQDGHGFGLHSGALAAQELGGSLQAASDGPGRGAVFTLELPLDSAEARAA